MAEKPDNHESKALAAERTLRSEWRVYQPDGSYALAENFDFNTSVGLTDLFAYEREGTRVAEDAPPHIKLMREHELVDYEPASDSGNLRWYPKGLLIKRLLEQHATSTVVDYGAMEVETPIMYDYWAPSAVEIPAPLSGAPVRGEERGQGILPALRGLFRPVHDPARHRDLIPRSPVPSTS